MCEMVIGCTRDGGRTSRAEGRADDVCDRPRGEDVGLCVGERVDRAGDGAHLDGVYAMAPGFLCLFSEDNERPAILPRVSIGRGGGGGGTSSVA